MIILVIIFFLAATYGILILYYWRNWIGIPHFQPNTQAQITISVIIPARNEESNIGILLQALKDQTYPTGLMEVIVVDDHSTDSTATVVSQFPFVKLIQLNQSNINSFKKKALETGIAAARGEMIVTTDADCIPTENWLQQIASFKIENRAIFIAAPVSIHCESSAVQIFQAMDFMVLQGITGAVVHKNQLSMCNGANLAYERNAFFEVGGFSGIDKIASGDDMLLMQKISVRYPRQLFYLKSREAIVETQPMKTWKEFFNQRIRWASKATHYQDKGILPVLLLVYLFNISFLFLFIAGFWDLKYWIALLGLLLFKTLVELPLFISVAKFFNKQWSIKWFPLFQPLHIFYTILSGLFGQFGKYEWKGRKVS